MLSIIIIVVLAIIAFAIGFLTSIPGHYQVTESRTLKTSAANAYNKIRDFKTWSEWSPWLLHEPDTELTFSDHCDQEGGHYSWDGKFVGTGTLTHNKFIDNESIEQTIEFIRPFKSSSQVSWQFDAISDNEVEISWSMKGFTPWYMRWMTLFFSMEKMISNDYQLGLLMLDRILCEHSGEFAINFIGETEKEGIHGIYQEYQGKLEGLSEVMEKGFTALAEQIKNENLSVTSVPLSTYRDTNPKTMTSTCHMVVPVEPASQDNEIDIAGGSFFKIEYKGSYEHLPLVWHAAMSHVFMTKQKFDKNAPSMEIYITDPEQVAPDDAITELYIPLRSS